MQITRHLRASDRPAPALHAASLAREDSCLDCADCRGLCWSRVELALVPDRVLRASARGSA